MATDEIKLRITFEVDEDSRFEECNGEARPLTEAEYRGNEYRACPDHPRAGTQVIDLGTGFCRTCQQRVRRKGRGKGAAWVDEAGGTFCPGTAVTHTNPDRVQVQGCKPCARTDYVDIPYDEYRAYYGNPERHVYVQAYIERQCGSCGHWEATGDSLGRLDLMDTDPGVLEIGATYTEAQLGQIPGYLQEVARGLFREARTAPEEARHG